MLYFESKSGEECVENGAMLTTYLFTYTLIQNAPFRRQFFKTSFASGGKGALTPPDGAESAMQRCPVNCN